MDSPLAPMLLPLWVSFVFTVFACMQLVAIRVEAAFNRSSAGTFESTSSGSLRLRRSYSHNSSTGAILIVTFIAVAAAIGNSVVTVMVLNYTP